jgi:hypothetical protein
MKSAAASSVKVAANISRDLSNRNRLPRQQGLIGLQLVGRHEDGIGRYAISFGQNDSIAAHYVAASDPPAFAAADDERARARQVP